MTHQYDEYDGLRGGIFHYSGGMDGDPVNIKQWVEDYEALLPKVSGFTKLYREAEENPTNADYMRTTATQLLNEVERLAVLAFKNRDTTKLERLRALSKVLSTIKDDATRTGRGMSGGLKGVSRASGFIQRSMAELKKKEGKYGKATNVDLPALNLKEGNKFSANKISKQSPFVYNHLTKGVPYENNRLNPILSTGQTAGVRVIDGKEQSFKQSDPKYNKHTLRFYPLPRAGLRKLTAKEEAQKKKAIDEYTELLKNAFPKDFEKNPNATPTTSSGVSRKRGKKNQSVSQPVVGKITLNEPMTLSFK